MKFSITPTRRGWNVRLAVEPHEAPTGFYVTDAEVCVYDPDHAEDGKAAHDRSRYRSRIEERAALALRETGPGEKILARPRLMPKPFTTYGEVAK